MNELLLWMSAQRMGSSASFRVRSAELSGARRGGPGHHRVVAWNLSRLGHAEFGLAAEGGWRVCPPVLAAADPCGTISAILCGARTPALLQRVAGVAGAAFGIEVQPEGPDVVKLRCESADALAEIAGASGLPLQWNAPLAALAACEPPISAALRPAEMPVGAWTVSRFSKTGLGWVASKPGEARDAQVGLYRFRSDRGTIYILKQDGQAFASDPATGKYRILTRRHRPFAYGVRPGELSIAAACRPPELVERALTVCSGRLAPLENGRIVYRGVGRHVAQAAASVLRQRLHWG